MTLLVKQKYLFSLVCTLLMITFTFSSAFVVAGETDSVTILPMDSLSSEGSSYTSLQSSEEEILSLQTTISALYQEKIVIGEPVRMYQLITLHNTGSEAVSGIFSLASYQDDLPVEYILEAESIEMTMNGEIIAEDYFTAITLQPGETKEIYVDYTFAAVTQTITCETKTLADMLPSQAKVTSTTIGLRAELLDVCTLTLFHEGTIHYYDVEVNLDTFSSEKITSIYYVQGEMYLDLVNTTIQVPIVTEQ